MGNNDGRATRVLALGLGLGGGLMAGCASALTRGDMTFTQAAPPRPAPGPVAIAAAPPPACAPAAGWNDPATPRRVHGDTWYVGTCGITVLLLASPRGHVLIDAGPEASGFRVEASLRALGFRIQDVRYIVVSHAHEDHVGGLALLQRDSGAAVVARAPAIAALREGRGDRRDPQFLVADGFQPIPPAALKTIADGETLQLGPLAVTAHATPGHTPGGTSWTWTDCGPAAGAEPAGCLRLAYTDSVTPISDDAFRFSDPSPVGRRALAAERQGLAALAGLPCDVQLTPHPGASRLWERLGPGATRPLVEPGVCRAYAARGERLLDARLARERAGLKPGEAIQVPPEPDPAP